MSIILSRLRRASVFALLAATAVGCATVTRGTKEAWTVQSTPPGASVATSVGMSCEATPCTFKLQRKAEFDVTISKAGYKTIHTRVLHQVSNGGAAGMAGNVLLGGLIGAGVDVASGAMMELKPNPLIVIFETDAPPPVAATPGLAPTALPTATPPAAIPAVASSVPSAAR